MGLTAILDETHILFCQLVFSREQVEVRMEKQAQYLYLRESNGISYQCSYNPSSLLASILGEIDREKSWGSTRLICRGRLLQPALSLEENYVRPYDIIHLVAERGEAEQGGFVYISYENKIHRIVFESKQTVQQFMAKVEKEIGVAPDQQVILANSIPMDSTKLVADYQIRSSDFLCMAKRPKVKRNAPGAEVIYPKKILLHKRRASEVHPTENLILSEHPKTNSPELLVKGQKQVMNSKTSHTLVFGPESLSQLEESSSRPEAQCFQNAHRLDNNNSIFHSEHPTDNKNERHRGEPRIYQSASPESCQAEPKTAPRFIKQIVMCESINDEAGETQSSLEAGPGMIQGIQKTDSKYSDEQAPQQMTEMLPGECQRGISSEVNPPNYCDRVFCNAPQNADQGPQQM